MPTRWRTSRTTCSNRRRRRSRLAVATSPRCCSDNPRMEDLRDRVVRPLLPLWREETEAYCEANGLPFRRDTSNGDTVRGRIRNEVLPLLRAIHPAAEANLLRALEERATIPPAVAELLASTVGS